MSGIFQIVGANNYHFSSMSYASRVQIRRSCIITNKKTAGTNKEKWYNYQWDNRLFKYGDVVL